MFNILTTCTFWCHLYRTHLMLQATTTWLWLQPWTWATSGLSWSCAHTSPPSTTISLSTGSCLSSFTRGREDSLQSWMWEGLTFHQISILAVSHSRRPHVKIRRKSNILLDDTQQKLKLRWWLDGWGFLFWKSYSECQYLRPSMETMKMMIAKLSILIADCIVLYANTILTTGLENCVCIY